MKARKVIYTVLIVLVLAFVVSVAFFILTTKKSKAVAVQVFMPDSKPDTALKNTLVLNNEKAVLTVNGVAHTISYGKLPAAIGDRKDVLAADGVQIVVTDCSYKNVVDALDVMSIHKIDKYTISDNNRKQASR